VRVALRDLRPQHAAFPTALSGKETGRERKAAEQQLHHDSEQARTTRSSTMLRFISNSPIKTNSKVSSRTFAHSRTVVNDKGGNIFVVSHGESVCCSF
jgi:hypothetical protein